MSKLRSTKQTLLADATTVSASGQSNFVDLGTVEQPFTIQAIWTNGSSPNIDLIIELSNDKDNWAEVTATTFNVAVASGNHMWDLTTGAEFCRVRYEVTSGSADFTIKMNGKTRDR